MSVLGRIGRPILGAAAQVLSVPVYFGFAGVVRVANIGRPRRPLDPDVAALMEPHFTDLDLTTVRIVHPAVIPSARRSTSGLTIGSTIHLKVAPSADDLRAMRLVLHELVHVRQNADLGSTRFAHRYGVGWARHVSYRENPFEVEAYGYEAECRPTLAAAIAAARRDD